MATIIVAFPKMDEAKAIRNLLLYKGYDVAPACVTGAQVINQADNLSDGIIICGYKLSDNMVYRTHQMYRKNTYATFDFPYLYHKRKQHPQ